VSRPNEIASGHGSDILLPGSDIRISSIKKFENNGSFVRYYCSVEFSKVCVIDFLDIMMIETNELKYVFDGITVKAE